MSALSPEISNIEDTLHYDFGIILAGNITGLITNGGVRIQWLISI